MLPVSAHKLVASLGGWLAKALKCSFPASEGIDGRPFDSGDCGLYFLRHSCLRSSSFRSQIHFKRGFKRQMIKELGLKVPYKDAERRLASEREEGEERCNLDLISHPCPRHGSASTSTCGRMGGLRRGCACYKPCW